MPPHRGRGGPGPPPAPARPSTPAQPSARAPCSHSAHVLVAGQAGGELSRHAQLVRCSSRVASTTPGGGSRVGRVYSAGCGLLRPLLLLLLHPGCTTACSPGTDPDPTPVRANAVRVGHGGAVRHGKDTARTSPSGRGSDPRCLPRPACQPSAHAANHRLCCQHWPPDSASPSPNLSH